MNDNLLSVFKAILENLGMKYETLNDAFFSTTIHSQSGIQTKTKICGAVERNGLIRRTAGQLAAVSKGKTFWNNLVLTAK